MKPWDSDKNPLPKFHFDSDQTFEEFLKARMKEELGLIENPSSNQVKKILKVPRRPKSKLGYFKHLIKEIT